MFTLLHSPPAESGKLRLVVVETIGLKTESTTPREIFVADKTLFGILGTFLNFRMDKFGFVCSRLPCCISEVRTTTDVRRYVRFSITNVQVLWAMVHVSFNIDSYYIA